MAAGYSRRARIDRVAAEARSAGYRIDGFHSLLVAWFRAHARPPSTLEQIEREVLLR